MLWLSILVSSFLVFVISNGGYEATPLQAVCVPLLVGRSIPHQRGRQALSFLLTQGLLTCFTPPFVMFGLAYHDPVLWVVTFIMGFTICQHQWALMSFPLPYVCVPSEVCSHITLPEVFTCPQWMTPVDVHGRSHNFPFFHPKEALLVGRWVTTLPFSSCDVLFLSPLAEVVLHGVVLVHLSHVWQLPIHKGMPISDAMRRSWFQWRTHDLPCWFVTS